MTRSGSRVPIVYFGNDWFPENRTSSHHIAQRLSERYPLLYVECHLSSGRLERTRAI